MDCAYDSKRIGFPSRFRFSVCLPSHFSFPFWGILFSSPSFSDMVLPNFRCIYIPLLSLFFLFYPFSVPSSFVFTEEIYGQHTYLSSSFFEIVSILLCEFSC